MLHEVGRKQIDGCVRRGLAEELGFFLLQQFSLQNHDGFPLSKLSERDEIGFPIGAELVHGTLVKPNGEKMPFVTFGEPDAAYQVAITRHSLRTDGDVPKDLASTMKRSPGFIYNLKIKKPNPVICTIEQFPDAHLPIWFDPCLDRTSERAHLGRFLKSSMHWFGDEKSSLPDVGVGKPQVSGWLFLRRWG
jgi:hypothetical protein